MDLARFDFEEVTTITAGDLFVGKISLLIDRRIRLRNEIVLFPVRGQIIDLGSHPAIFNPAVWSLDKSKLVDPCKGAHRADKADIGAFRCLNRTDPAVVRRMHIPHFESCAVPTQSTRPKSG